MFLVDGLADCSSKSDSSEHNLSQDSGPLK